MAKSSPSSEIVAPEPSEAVLHFPSWARKLWTAQPKTGPRGPFVLTGPQRIMEYEVEKQVRAGRPVRVKVIKYRQATCSYYWTAKLQNRAQNIPGHRGLSIADKLELPREWLRRAQRWYRETPEDLRPRLAASNAIELYFDEIDSRYSIGSQAGQTPGMGFTLHDVHASEMATWSNVPKVLGDLLPAVPNEPGTMVALEGTGEMEGDWWQTEVEKSRRGLDDFVLIFLPWFIDPGYLMDPAAIGHPDLAEKDYTEDEREFVANAERWAREHPVHAELAGYQRPGPRRVAWRRWTLVNDFGGDVDRFKSKYPSTIDEAFLGIGSAAIPLQIRRQHRAQSADVLVQRGQLEWVDESLHKLVKLAPERFTEDQKEAAHQVRMVPFEHDGPIAMWPPHWRVYEGKQRLCEYTAFADVAEGKLSDPQDERSERDSSTIGVLNRRELSTAALFKGRVEADELGDELEKAGYWWNEAWISPEANSAGQATLAVVKQYKHLMPRSGNVDEEQERTLPTLGWKTTPQNRDWLIDSWIEACRPDLDGGFEGKITCLSAELADEEATFVRTKLGKREHRAGCWDDVLFAFMGARMLHEKCPHVRYTDMEEQPDRSALYRRLGAKQHPSMAFAGGVDDEWDKIMAREARKR